MKATIILLAGGKSSRFGQDKTVLKLDGEMILERVVRECRPIFDEILIVNNKIGKFSFPDVRELNDIYKQAGPLGGIHSGLTHMRNEVAFVAACDMPFFEPEPALRLVGLCEKYSAAVPRDKDRIQPLFAAYKRCVLPEIETLLKLGKRSVRELFDMVSTGYLEREDWCESFGDGEKLFYNINYPEDYQKLKQHASIT